MFKRPITTQAQYGWSTPDCIAAGIRWLRSPRAARPQPTAIAATRVRSPGVFALLAGYREFSERP